MLALAAPPAARPAPGIGGGPWASGESAEGLPEAGDSIGPYLLRRELGRGSFARVFLAEQADLANRLVVVKIATRATREPWLLARARHAHIVEILSHAEVDDGAFQLICMPFWGGATLADVLRRRRSAGSRPGRRSVRERGTGRRRATAPPGPPATGADLLAALDAVAAPRVSVGPPGAAGREILAPLSYDRAIAWVIARLAEALDHASGRDVAHGDVKPSNILLSADGNPMLLDFNLARDVAPALDPSGASIDPGGTLAYMAPERLRALASAGSGRPGWPADSDGEALDRMGISTTDRPPGTAHCLRHLLAGDGVARGADRPAAVGGRGAGGPGGGPGREAGPADLDGDGLRGGPRAPAAGDHPRLRGGLGPADRAGPARDPRAVPRPGPDRGDTAAPWSWPRTWTDGGPTGRWPTPTSRSGGRRSRAGCGPAGGS